MKRHELLKIMTRAKCILVRHGKKHDIYMNTKNGRKAPVPRHSEIKDTLCELIKKQLDVE